ncbi:inheritance of peroxisomes protein 1-domain-containing protein [Ustulina deusta]|nr:inheritance of peroxisomes protein 1-domain-containing protein [Ustulina deusta]
MDSASFASGGSETPQPRRVMTAPVLASTSPQQSTSPASQAATATAQSKASPEDLVETLYSHPSARIISFTSSRHDFATSFSGHDAPPGSLPPSSRLERTIAVGVFRIYRAPGSVAFLSCGSALQPILPKSQCWCIDEDNRRFVLQIRRPQYWRIEVPVAHPDDVRRALQLRDVFDRILLFEKTECPFERSFTVQLPDETPIKKKAWTAEGKNLISSPFESDLSPPAQGPMALSRDKWATEDSDHLMGALGYTMTKSPSSSENVTHDPMSQEIQDSRRASDDTTVNQLGAMITELQQKCSLSDQKDDDILNPGHSIGEDDPAPLEGSGRVGPVNLARKRVTRMLAGRSFAAPAPPTPMASTPSKPNEQVAAKKSLPSPPPTLARGHSSSVSTDSFHNAQPWHSRIRPSPASPRARDVSSEPEDVESLELISRADYSSEHATTPNNTINIVPRSSAISDGCDSAEPTPRPARFIMNKEVEEPIGSESGSRVSPPSTLEDKLRAHRRSHANSLSINRQALSPLPPAASLFYSAPRQTPQSRLAAVRRLPASILHKTLEMLLGPPSYLIKLMLQVAAKIVAGEWRGLVFGVGEAGEEIPVQWDYYSDGEFSDLSDGDDYTLTNRDSNFSHNVPRTDGRRRTRRAHHNDDDSCEVD